MTPEYLSKQLIDVVEKAKSNKQVLRKLKDASVHAQMYELAAELRDIEVKNFPKSEEQKEAEWLARNIQTLLSMGNLSVPVNTCWLLFQIISVYNKKKGKTDLKTITDLVNTMDILFKED